MRSIKDRIEAKKKQKNKKEKTPRVHCEKRGSTVPQFSSLCEKRDGRDQTVKRVNVTERKVYCEMVVWSWLVVDKKREERFKSNQNS